MTKQIVHLKQIKHTKRFIRYEDTAENVDEESQILPSIYIRKSGLLILGSPEHIKVTIEAE